jgi:hypothetical protein
VPDDDLTATLAGIRDEAQSSIAYADDHACPDIGNSCSAHHALLLLAAVDAVLKEHRPDLGETSFCQECGHSWPCMTVRVITRKLTGEAGDGRA